MKLKIEKLEGNLPGEARIGFGRQGKVPKTSNWFVCVQNGEMNPAEFRPTVQQLLKCTIDVPLHGDSEVWIIVRSTNGRIYSESNRLFVEMKPKSLLYRLNDLWQWVKDL